jgi:WhiB family redox-sensing transcriptional regulator
MDDLDVLTELLRGLCPAWRRDALCREHPEVNWFPERGESSKPAKDICAQCIVRAECLEYGLKDDYGIWGGTGVRERKRQRVERRELVVGRDRSAAA